jgi:hypothetical protein
VRAVVFIAVEQAMSDVNFRTLRPFQSEGNPEMLYPPAQEK